MYSITPEIFKKDLIDTIEKIQILKSQKGVNDAQLRKFLTTFSIDGENSIDNNTILSTATLKHGLWNRIENGIGTTTANIDSYHRVLRKVIGAVTKFERRFSRIARYILTISERFFKNQHRQAKDLLLKLKMRVAVLDIAQSPTCPKNCGWSKYYSNLLGISNFPCVHTVTFYDNDVFPEIKFDLNKNIGDDSEFEEIGDPIATPDNEPSNISEYNNGPDDLLQTSESDSEEFNSFIIETAKDIFSIAPEEFGDFHECIIFTAKTWGSQYGKTSQSENLVEDRQHFWIQMISETLKKHEENFN